MLRRHLAGALAIVLTAAVPAALLAQDTSCTYQSCALRLSYRFMGARVVAGGADSVVSRPGVFRFTVPALAAAGDSARWHYAAYRRTAPRAAMLGLAAAGSAIASFVFIGNDADQHEVANVVLITTGLVSGFLAGVVSNRANDHLERAMWHFNAGLAAPR
jgi:hypothetical protein